MKNTERVRAYLALVGELQSKGYEVCEDRVYSSDMYERTPEGIVWLPTAWPLGEIRFKDGHWEIDWFEKDGKEAVSTE